MSATGGKRTYAPLDLERLTSSPSATATLIGTALAAPTCDKDGIQQRLGLQAGAGGMLVSGSERNRPKSDGPGSRDALVVDRRTLLAGAAALPLLGVAPAPRPRRNYPKSRTAAQKLGEGMAANNIGAAALALVDEGGTFWSSGFGSTKHGRVDGDTLFSVQSISKTYTTAAFLAEATRGRNGLDWPLLKVMPNFKVRDRFGSQTEKINFRQLLSHWSGLPHEADRKSTRLNSSH